MKIQSIQYHNNILYKTVYFNQHWFGDQLNDQYGQSGVNITIALAIIRRRWTKTINIGPMELYGKEDGSNDLQIAPFPR
jgi:hypothetical protein